MFCSILNVGLWDYSLCLVTVDMPTQFHTCVRANFFSNIAITLEMIIKLSRTKMPDFLFDFDQLSLRLFGASCHATHNSILCCSGKVVSGTNIFQMFWVSWKWSSCPKHFFLNSEPLKSHFKPKQSCIFSGIGSSDFFVHHVMNDTYIDWCD